MHNSSRPAAPLRVLIIGSGFAGLGMAIRLQQAGIEEFLILEKAADIGGTWRDNSYPGAACDVPSHLYSFSFEPKTDWSRKFAPQAEIHAYMQHCVAKYRLRPRIRCNAEVLSASFDQAAALWRVTLGNGEELSAALLISACGQLNRPAYPSLPGIERFQGAAFHSARWRHDLDLTGKRVAVIGTGASAIQFVPQIQPRVAELKLFQRSAAYVLSKPDRAYRAWELAVMRRLPWLQRIDRMLKYVQHETRGLAFISMPWLMKPMRLSFERHLRRHIRDPQLRAQLQPDYPMGCKRILISNDYLPALAQANVQVVGEAISQVRAHSLVTADGREHPCDVLIYGTGFAATEFLAPMQIRGLGGRELNQAWHDGAEAYKGISVSGFPNLFILYGPNTNLGHNSIIYMLESQFRYVLGCIDLLRDQGLRYLDVKASVQQDYNQRIQAHSHRTIWEQGCTSWYKTATGKSTNNWPGYTFAYRHLTRAPELNDYEFTPPAVEQTLLRTVLRGGLRLLFRGLVRPPTPIAGQRAVLRLLTAVSPPPRGITRSTGTLAGRLCEWHRPQSGQWHRPQRGSWHRPQGGRGTVLLYLHGGAYLIGGPNTHRAICSHLAKRGQLEVCALDYRLAPEHQYPAAREDAVAAFQALIELGYKPEQIVIGGDSAGGNLSLITSLHLRDLGQAQPAALVCFSPVTDFTGTQLHQPPAGDPLIHHKWVEQALALYCPAGLAHDDPGLSPQFADLHGLAPLLIQVGEDEILRNDSLRFADKARAAGVDVRLQRYPGLWHVFQAHAGLLKAADFALAEVVSFLRQRGC